MIIEDQRMNIQINNNKFREYNWKDRNFKIPEIKIFVKI